MIEIRNLHKSFGPLKVLQGVDLDITTGESLVVLGRSGTGKSVLIKHIIGLLEPDAGSVHVGRHGGGQAQVRRAVRAAAQVRHAVPDGRPVRLP